MAKKYIVENAGLNCQYGEQSWLVVPGNRHIEISGKMMANETDYKRTCLGCGGFGRCHSPHVSGEAAQAAHDLLLDNKLTSLHQHAVAGGIYSCWYELGPQWVETKEDVYIAGLWALLEDSWTFCTFGLGIISLINSGQNENAAETLKEHLKQLEKIIDMYIKENGLSKKSKYALLNSVLFWNGYGFIPWKTEISQELWDFGIYMENNYPSLVNYFERGIYLFDEQTGVNIDIGYMAGLSVAMTQPSNNCWSLLTNEVFEDEAVYNGYLEASRLESSENALEAMEKFLNYYEIPQYSGNSRYSDYLEISEEFRDVYEDMYRRGCSMDGRYYEPRVPLDYYGDPNEIMERQEKLSRWSEWSQEEKDLLILERALSPYVGDAGAIDFVRKVCKSAGRERMSWEE